MNKTLRNTLVGLTGLASLAGCGQNRNEIPRGLEGNFRGYPVSVLNGNNYKMIWIRDTEHQDNLLIHGVDYFNRNGDGFDEIQIYGSPKNEVIHYANPDSLEAAYQTVLKQYEEQGDSQ